MILIYRTFFTLKFEKNIQISWPTLTEGLERPTGMKKIIAVLGPFVIGILVLAARSLDCGRLS